MIEEMCALPNGWSRSKVGSLCKMIRGVSYPKVDAKKQLSKGYYPVLRGGNIQDEIIFKDLVFVPSKYIKDEQYIKRFDVVLAMSSGSRNIVGKAAQAKEDYKGSFGAFCGLLRPNKQIEPRFFGYYFKTKDYRTKISNLSAGVNINNLRRGYIENLSIPLPPLPEQKRIIAKIENLLDRLNKTRQELAKIPPILKKFRQAVLLKAFRGELTEQNPNDEPASFLLERIHQERKKQLGKKYKEPEPIDASSLPKLPKGWKWARLGSIIESSQSGFASGKKDVKEGLFHLRMNNINSECNLNLDLVRTVPKNLGQEKYLLKKGDVLICHTNSQKLVGKSTIFNINGRYAFSNHLTRIIFFDNTVKPEWIWYYIGTLWRQGYFETRCKQWVNQATIEKDTLLNITIPIPPFPEQYHAIKKVQGFFAQADAIEKYVKIAQARCEKMTQSILAKAFRGELVPQDSNEKPASVLLEKIKVKKEKRLQARR